MSAADALPGIIDELYAGVFDDARLANTLHRVTKLAGASGTMFYVHYHGELTPRLLLSDLDLTTFFNIDLHDSQLVTQCALKVPLGHVRPVSATWPVAEMKKTAFYNNVLKKLELVHGAAGLALRNPDYYSTVVMTRTEHAGPFADEQMTILRALVPHIRNTIQIRTATDALVHARTSLAMALDALQDGVVLIGGQGKVIYLNRAAERMTGGHDGLSIRKGILTGGTPDENRALQRLTGHAGANGKASSFERGGSCTIGRPSGAPPWLILATPSSDMHARAVSPLLPVCTVLIRDRSRQGKHIEEQLIALYGLTAQESRIAVAVAEGGGLNDAARRLSLSPLTVRNHLQRVFAKTGTHRQAELARFIARLVN